ncbi:MAG: hypothetical protein KAR20_17360, partial [Candidatus Heimdallarchaeota archaeon]|nr:hypothetical protein [Candidatus Heimdallarchaeota archaeon]
MHQIKKVILLKRLSVFIKVILIQVFVNMFFTVNAADLATTKDTVRIALFNIWEMSTVKLSDIDIDGVGQDDQLIAAAEIISRVRPEVLVINEIDHDIAAV